MEYWVTWLIILGIGLVTGFVVHGLTRFTQGGSVMTTLLAGVIGALIAAYYVAPNVGMAGVSEMGERFTVAVIGALILSLVTELLFVGSRRGRVVTL